MFSLFSWVLHFAQGNSPSLTYLSVVPCFHSRVIGLASVFVICCHAILRYRLLHVSVACSFDFVVPGHPHLSSFSFYLDSWSPFQYLENGNIPTHMSLKRDYSDHDYPTGIALTPVPQSLSFRFDPRFLHLPPLCVLSSSTSSTDQVRFVSGTSSTPEVDECLCGLSNSTRCSVPSCFWFRLP